MSNWLISLPITEYSFATHKGAFKDAVCLLYRWKFALLPNNFIYNKQFAVDHAFSCSFFGRGLFHLVQWDQEYCNPLSDIYHNIWIKPQLQTILGLEGLQQVEPWLDIKAQKYICERIDKLHFWYKNIRSLYTNLSKSLHWNCYRRNKQIKRRGNDQIVKEKEHDCFMSLDFTYSGGKGQSVKVICKK